VLRCIGTWLRYAASCRSANKSTLADAGELVLTSKAADKMECRASHAVGFLVGKPTFLQS
jgi:hypothetical protein